MDQRLRVVRENGRRSNEAGFQELCLQSLSSAFVIFCTPWPVGRIRAPCLAAVVAAGGVTCIEYLNVSFNGLYVLCNVQCRRVFCDERFASAAAVAVYNTKLVKKAPRSDRLVDDSSDDLADSFD